VLPIRIETALLRVDEAKRRFVLVDTRDPPYRHAIRSYVVPEHGSGLHPWRRLSEKTEMQEGGRQPLEVTRISEELEGFLDRPRHHLAPLKPAKLHG
jgi:hypothetical protein